MSIEAMKQAFEVPLVEQLESVPTNARLVIDDADGMGTQYIPVGRMCHDASKALRQAIAEAERQKPVARQKYGVSPCARHCEANAFQIEIKNLKGDIERAILAEREACLKICEEQAVTAYWEGADVCVEEIKKRNFKI